MGERKYAVKVIRANKKYSKELILKNLSMKVPEGSIYGLLGPSGCGKTTLLSSLVGRIKLDSGRILMTATSRAQIGFMPQDITLFPDMTIKEHLFYYGRLYALPHSLIEKRGEEFIEFLQLPSLQHVIKNLSGGQQRRVSLCVALIHSPQLLILDEPTVGVDIELAASIWEKLLQMSQNEGKTIIITTHYIEEARRSNTIGLMRNGELLAEEKPQTLMELHDCDTLEGVFLKLCSREFDGRNGPAQVESSADFIGNDKPEPHLKGTSLVTSHRVKAHIMKNIYWMKRNIPMMLFTFALPIVQCVLASVTIGEKPTGLSLAVVNDEMPLGMSSCLVRNWLGPVNCTEQVLFSCLIAQKLLNKSIGVMSYKTLAEAECSVKKNKHWGLVHFNPQFSAALQERLTNLPSLKNGTVIELSQMNVRLDESNEVISGSLKGDLVSSLMETVYELCQECSWRLTGAGVPFLTEKPIFGSGNPSVRQYMTPANAVLFEFYFPVLFTVSVLIDEKSSGLLDRSLIAGLGVLEIGIGHMIMQYFVLFIQTLLEWAILFYFFDNPILPGTFPACFSFLLLVGTCGVFYAFLIVYMSNSFTEAAVLTFGGYFPIFMLSGAIWPIEGMHHILRWIAETLPITRGVEAFRSLSSRGWTVAHFSVYSSIIALLVWSCLYSSLCFFLSRSRGVKL